MRKAKVIIVYKGMKMIQFNCSYCTECLDIVDIFFRRQCSTCGRKLKRTAKIRRSYL